MPSSDSVVRHVLMTADAVGGVWTYALTLAAGLAARGIRTTIATMGAPARADQRRASEAIPGLTLLESTFRLEWMDEPWADVARAGTWLQGIEKSVSPDVVHLNGYVHGALPWRVPRIVVAHSCVLSWWRAVLGESAPTAYDRYRAHVARGLRAADAVVAPTRAMLRAVGGIYGAGREESVIPNGLDVAKFQPGPKEPFVLAAGRMWDRAKNLEALESAAPRLSWPVFVAGDAPATASASPHEPCVHALGPLSSERLRAWMARAAIYALPARYEPFGLSVLEAALSGCALVLGDIDSLHEVWGDAACYVPPGDVDALVESIERLASDSQLRGRMAAKARNRGLSFTADRMVERYVALYRRLTLRESSGEARRCG